MAKLVESVYGDALFAAAKEQGCLALVRSEAEELLQILDKNPDYIRILTHPAIEKDEKLGLINEAFAERLHPLLTGTIYTLIDRDHSAKLEKTLDAFIALSLEEEGIGVAYVTSGFELSETQKKAIEDKLIATTRYDRMRMNYIVDRTIIGGLKIQLGDKLVDSSISTKLETLRKSLERNI